VSEHYPKTAEQWQAFVFDPGEDRLKKLDKMAEEMYFHHTTVAEELQKRGLDSLSANNWAKLTNFKGLSSPETYLIRIYRNILIDQQRKLFGRCRPPQWVTQAGGEWVLAHKLLCCERRDREEIIVQCCSIYQLTSAWVKQLIREIRAKITDCSGTQRPTAEPEQTLDDPDSKTTAISSATGDEDYEILVHALADLLENQGTESWDILRRQVKLTNEQIAILRLRFIDNMSEQQIANQYQKTRDQVRRSLKKTLAILKQALIEAGIGAEDILPK